MNKLRGVAVVDKKPLIMETKEKNGQFLCYDGEEHGYITNEKRKEIRSLKTEYIIVTRDKNDTRPLKEIYESFVHDADYLKKATKGLINMYRTGRDSQTALNLAYHFLNKKKVTAEPITVEEARWINYASQGALRFADKNYKGNIWKYDINSSYPSIYSSVYFQIPLKVGEFKTLTKKEFTEMKNFSIGIYHAKVDYPDDKKPYHKIFKQNKLNYYTHQELHFAKKHNFIIQLIEDKQPNFLHYARDTVLLGSQSLKGFVDYMYQLRKDHPKVKDRCKKIMNSLWGALCQADSFKVRFRLDEEAEIRDDKEIIEEEWDDTHIILTLVHKDKPFETNYARMKPFLLAKGRIKIAEYIYPHMEHIKRCHTDSMLSDIDLKIKSSNELGELRFEGMTENTTILNMNKVLYPEEE